jgi:hypothetical protein
MQHTRIHSVRVVQHFIRSLPSRVGYASGKLLWRIFISRKPFHVLGTYFATYPLGLAVLCDFQCKDTKNRIVVSLYFYCSLPSRVGLEEKHHRLS